MLKKVGILGGGYIASYHAKALSAVSGARLTAVCDSNLEVAERFAAAHGGPNVYGSLDAMLASEQLDVVHVLLPPERHFAACKQLLERGVHILCEKPLCTTEAESRELEELARKHERQLGTSHNFLFSGIYEELRDVVRSGRLGRIDEIEIVWNKFLPQARFGPFSAWMLREPQNIMLEVGPHSGAHLLDLVGKVDDLRVDVDLPLQLPRGKRFYQRWDVRATAGSTQAHLRYSLIAGYTEHRVHVRGTLASATADFERDLFWFQHHRPLAPDFDRIAAITSEAAEAVAQGSRTFVQYALTKAKLAKTGAPFEASIQRSVRAFYERLGTVLDERHSAGFAAAVVGLGQEIGRRAHIEPAAPFSPPTRSERQAPPDVVVTGATGFIGREVVRQLVASGRSVRILTRSAGSVPAALENLPLDVCAGDLADAAFVARSLQGVPHVIHLARSQGNTWKEYEDGDIAVTRRLAEACIEQRVKRFVYASSIVIYYTGAAAGTITEDTPPDEAIMLSQAYAKSKVVSEQLLLDMEKQRGLPLVIVRPGIVIGPGGNPCHWGVGMWPQPSVCAISGDGQTQLPLVLVSDVADAVARCLTADGVVGQSFNLVGDATLSAHEYLDELDRAAGIRVERRTGVARRTFVADMAKYAFKRLAKYPDPTRPSYRAADARTNAAHFDCSRAKRVLAWKPTTDRTVLIEQGIRVPVSEFML